jgi:hypothetical protein
MLPLNKVLPDYPFRFANMHFAMKSREYMRFHSADDKGLPATCIHAACAGTGVDWLLMCAVAAVKSDYWRRDPGEYYACGITGSFAYQTLNSARKWKTLKDLGDLKMPELEIIQVELVYKALVRFCEGMSEAETGEPLPKPEPEPIPEPVKPEPKPVEVKPVPPPEVKPEPAKPTGGWRTKFKWIGGIASTILTLWFIVGNFLPPGIGAAVKAILKLLEGVF